MRVYMVSKMWTYIAHHHKTSNALGASVYRKEKCLQRSSKTVPTNNRIVQAVRYGIPDQWTSHTEKSLAIGAEPVEQHG